MPVTGALGALRGAIRRLALLAATDAAPFEHGSTADDEWSERDSART
jgi:hypothetical protein